MNSKQEQMVNVVDPETGSTKAIPRSKVCFKLREQEVDGKTVYCANDAFYKRDETGALRLLYNTKPGKAAKKAAKRERVKELRAAQV